MENALNKKGTIMQIMYQVAVSLMGEIIIKQEYYYFYILGENK